MINPNAYDGCDGIDQNCNGVADDDYREGWYLGTLENSQIHRIDTVTGNTSVVVDFGGDTTLNFSSTDLLDDTQQGVAHQGVDYALWKFDVCLETLWFVGPTGVVGMGGLSYGPTGRLFGFSQGTDAIVELNDQTGQASVLYNLAFDAGSAGMAYDCATETLYATDINSDTLYTIDPNTGAVLSSTPLSVALGAGGTGMEWDHVNQALILLADGDLYSVNPADGQTTYLSTLSGVTESNDLAFFPTCP